MGSYARLIEIFERLVAYQTVTGNKHATFECLMFIERILTIAGLNIQKYSSNGYESLVATTQETKQPTIFLQAHIDVVPASKELFTLKRRGKKLVGRGAFDMKYAAACFLLLVEELQPELSKYNIGLMFTSDEEADGLNGVKYLLRQGYGCDICFLPDGGDNWRLETAAKGGWIVDVHASGKTSHGSRPWEGENAIDKLTQFLSRAHLLIDNHDKTGTTMTVSKISGGETHNQVPNSASATLDIRFRDSAALQSVIQNLQLIAHNYNVKLSTSSNIKPVELDPTLPLVQAWEQVVRSVRGEKYDGYALSFGASDARYFAEKNIPSLVTRPDGGGHHSENEWIDERGLYDFYECIKQYVDTIARIP